MKTFKQYIREANDDYHYTDEKGNKYRYGASGYVGVVNKNGINQGQQHISSLSDVHKKNYEKLYGKKTKNEEVENVAEGSLEEVDTRTLVNYVPKAGRTLASLPPQERKKRSGMMTRAYQKLIPRPDFSDEIKKYQDRKNKKSGVAEGSGPKEKQKTPYRDINSPASRDAAATQKSQMKKQDAAAKGKELLNKIAAKNEEVELDEVAAWQRKEGKNPSGGLNRKGIESYRRENPGSKLSMAVTTKPSKLKKGSKAWNRRKSFCARMGGMPGPMKDEKGRPTRKALSLRKWNC